jgi:4-hydroxy-2-oxoheptanedioate aldolase
MPTKQTQIGTIISADIPQLAGQLTFVGFDFLFIDLEHGNITDNTISALVLGKAAGTKILIRIAEISERGIKHAIDLGADGIIAPRVESIEEVQMMLDYTHYPPTGKRSVGFTLANRYGMAKEYIKDFKPIILPQIESVKGVELAETIAAMDSVDGLFVGPNDLSFSLGVPGQFKSDVFTTAYESVRTTCKKYNKIFAAFTVNTEAALEEVNKGADMVVAGIDFNLFLHMYAGMIKQLKG